MQAVKLVANCRPPEAQLDARNLTIDRRGGQHRILDNVSFALRPGEAIGVIGRSVSGKTILASAVVGLVSCGEVEVRLGGATLT